jgi:hypothetical protein
MVSIQRILLILFLCHNAFAITIIPLSLSLPKQYRNRTSPVSSSAELLLLSYPKISGANLGRIVTPYTDVKPKGVYPSRDSFIHGAIDAWAQNQHLCNPATARVVHNPSADELLPFEQPQ